MKVACKFETNYKLVLKNKRKINWIMFVRFQYFDAEDFDDYDDVGIIGFSRR